MTYATSEEYDRAVHRYRMEQITADGVRAENRKAKAIEDQTEAALAESVAFLLANAVLKEGAEPRGDAAS